ncbi:MAG TPA: DUF3108 domain-containing protein [Longimicrobium sp.]|jgi:hypothetical protein
MSRFTAIQILTLALVAAAPAPAAMQNPNSPATGVGTRLLGASLDSVTLRAGSATYRVTLRGEAMPLRINTELRRDSTGWIARFESGNLVQDTRFSSDLRPTSSETKLIQEGQPVGESRVEFADGRVTGRSVMPDQMGGTREFNVSVPPGTVHSGMETYLVAAADLRIGSELRFSLFSDRTGRSRERTLKVTGEERITVPAGTFEVYRLEEVGSPMRRIEYVQKAVPHVLVKSETGGDLIWELESHTFK